MAHGQAVTVLDPRIEQHLEKAHQAYLEHEEDMEHSWETLRPRVVKRLNYELGISEDGDDD